ncbi:MAG: methyl-accepting chemotaxis protein, partial [Bacteriovoracia bacterium]
AQEVGNLAQMSGQSAKEIAEIVNTSIKQAEQITTENRTKVDQGVNLVDSTSKVLFTITESANTVADGAKQILEASNEQNSGIQQINIAVGEVDKAVQENAATAEETASTSEELSSQTEVLNGIVEDIYILVHGQVMDGQAIGAEAKKVVKATSVKKTNLAPKITQPTKEEESKQASNTTGAQTHSDDAWDTL